MMCPNRRANNSTGGRLRAGRRASPRVGSGWPGSHISYGKEGSAAKHHRVKVAFLPCPGQMPIQLPRLECLKKAVSTSPSKATFEDSELRSELTQMPTNSICPAAADKFQDERPTEATITSNRNEAEASLCPLSSLSRQYLIVFLRTFMNIHAGVIPEFSGLHEGQIGLHNPGVRVV